MEEYKVVIIGCGVAGMTAAIYLARAGISCCILEANAPGGQIIDNGMIENYPGFLAIRGTDLALKILEQVKQLEVPVFYQKVKTIEVEEGKKIIHTSRDDFECDYMIIATGRHPKTLGLTNEAEYVGRGVSYCAICDGALYKHKNVVVVGGSDSAFSAVRYLAKLVNHVTLIHRRKTYRAQQALIDEVYKLNNVSFITGEVASLQVDANKVLSSITLTDGQVIATAALFIYIGQVPTTTAFESLSICDENGYIQVNQQYETKIDGIYAIGDCIAKEDYQIVIAMGEAAQVALAITRR